jgi:hypothetical protein
VEHRIAALGEIDRLSGCCQLARPKPTRARNGQWRRDPGGQWDWFYELDGAERAYIARRHMGDFGRGPDEIATDMDSSIDAAMTAWLSNVRVTRSHLDPLDDDYCADWEEAQPVEIYASDICGPDEVAGLLGVARDTVSTWRKRDRRDSAGRLPEPFAIISGVPLWTAQAIARHREQLAG